MKLKGEIEKFKITAEDLNTPLSIINSTRRGKSISIETE